MESPRNHVHQFGTCTLNRWAQQQVVCLQTCIVALVALIGVCSGCGGGAGASTNSGGGNKTSPPPSYTIGGTISGLSGKGLVLQNNSTSLTVNADGSFTFPATVTSGGAYDVSVLTQPANPSQTCTVTNGTGTANNNVTNVQVACVTVTSSYAVGGTVSGLSGTGLVLEDNSGDDLAISTNGAFTFATTITAGNTYSVTVKTQPTNPPQTCAVANGTGNANANVTTVQVSCTTIGYTIGGSVSGLSGSGLVLQDNGADNLTIAADGTFTFATQVVAGNNYSVTVKTQPTNPTQTCSVSNGGGTANANVTNVSVICSTTAFTVGGTLSGLTSGTVVVEDNGGDDLSLTANGTFTFATAIASGSNYNVTVKTQPSGQFCTVGNGSGTATANVTNVQVTCVKTSGNTIQQSFFGADFLLTYLVWPGTDGQGQVATLGSLRLWDDYVKWGQINTGKGVYQWGTLDSWISMAQSQNLQVLYTFGDTPQFAGTIPKPPVHCLTPTEYSCSPPTDVKSDGTGTDQFFSDFVTALVTRYKGQISYYELWNEPDCSCYFAGTQAQMVRMNKDASAIIHSIDPNAKVLSPSGHVWSMQTWFDPYIKAGGAATFDIVSMHMRGNGDLNLTPEAFLGTYSNIEADLVTNKVNNLPLWDSEHGIKASESLPDPDEQAGFVAREVALRAGIGLPRQFVYAWDDVSPVGLQGNKAGTAWDTIAAWLIGHSISPCVANGTVYTCNVDDGQIVWDTSQSCSNGVCTTSNYTYPSGYAWETDLSGTKTALSGKTVPIGYKPIFLTAK